MTGQVLEDPLEHELDPELQKELLTHPGRWVATTRSELLAVGDTASEVFEAARSQGVEHPVIYRVPADSDAVYFF
jgi:hypothetical protein